MHNWASGGNVQCCWCFCSRPAPYSSTSYPGIASVELIHWPTGPRDGWCLLFLSRWDCIFGTSSAWATQSASPPAQSRLRVVSGVDQTQSTIAVEATEGAIWAVVCAKFTSSRLHAR